MAGSIQTGKRKDAHFAHPPLEVRTIVVVTLYRRVLRIPYKWNVALTHVALSNFIWAIHSKIFIFYNKNSIKFQIVNIYKVFLLPLFLSEK